MIQKLEDLAKTFELKELPNEQQPQIIGVVANVNKAAVVACDDGHYGDYAPRPSSSEQYATTQQ